MGSSAWDLLESFDIEQNQLAGQTALVTGAARGIGEQLAYLLARLGANVVVADINPAGEAVARRIADDGGSAVFIACDLAIADEVGRLSGEAIEAFGGVDILVNGAMQMTVAPVVETAPDDWDRVFATNLRAAFLTCRHLLPGMVQRRYGVIVNLIAFEGSPLTAAYSATKVGLRSLSLTIARELGGESGVAAFSFIPGIVDTPAVRDVLIPGLSTRMGLSAQELEATVLAQNPGYPGLCPVEHCAAALAFTILHAPEYHGQVADPFEPLHRFGVIKIPSFEEVPSIGLTAEASLPLHLKQYLSHVSEHNRELEHRIEVRTRELAEANEQSESLLLNVLPRSIAERLKQGEGVIADHFDEVTVLFADIVGFTPMSERLPPEAVVQLLDFVFSELDRIAGDHGLEKIKTIGDCYMMVGGLPEPRMDHADAVAGAALDLLQAVTRVSDAASVPLSLRVGIHTGPVIAGVIGRRKFIYDLWGDTVNTASRMESHGVADRIHCTDAVYKCLRDRYEFEPRGEVEVKGKGLMSTYFLLRRSRETLSPSDSDPAQTARRNGEGAVIGAEPEAQDPARFAES